MFGSRKKLTNIHCINGSYLLNLSDNVDMPTDVLDKQNI